MARARTPNEPRVAVVTGGNRGIGLEVCRQLARRDHIVFLGSRDDTKGRNAARDIGADGLTVIPCQLDVTDVDSIERVRARVAADHGRLDVLVNNAAVLYDTWQHAIDADVAQVRDAFETNTIGALNMVHAFLPLLRKSRHARVVNVSSEGGSLASMGAGTPAYSISKAALNALTRILSAELRRDRILVNAVCPGWVETDMGGEGGRPVEEGAASVVWAAVLPDNGPTGGFFRDGHALPW